MIVSFFNDCSETNQSLKIQRSFQQLAPINGTQSGNQSKMTGNVQIANLYFEVLCSTEFVGEGTLDKIVSGFTDSHSLGELIYYQVQ